MRTTRTSLAAVGLLVPLVLTACGGDEAGADPEPIIPSSSAPSPEPSESVSDDAGEAPVMPEAAKARTAEGVEAFLGYWGDVVTYSENSGDVSSLADISSADCESCQGAIEFIRTIYEEGGSAEVAGWAVLQVGFAQNRGISEPVGRFRRGLEVIRRSGERAQRAPAARTNLQFELDWVDGAWVIARYYSVD